MTKKILAYKKTNQINTNVPCMSCIFQQMKYNIQISVISHIFLAINFGTIDRKYGGVWQRLLLHRIRPRANWKYSIYILLAFVFCICSANNIKTNAGMTKRFLNNWMFIFSVFMPGKCEPNYCFRFSFLNELW